MAELFVTRSLSGKYVCADTEKRETDAAKYIKPLFPRAVPKLRASWFIRVHFH